MQEKHKRKIILLSEILVSEELINESKRRN